MFNELAVPLWVVIEAEEDFAEPGVEMFDDANG
jgi:hypothetical protein